VGSVQRPRERSFKLSAQFIHLPRIEDAGPGLFLTYPPHSLWQFLAALHDAAGPIVRARIPWLASTPPRPRWALSFDDGMGGRFFAAALPVLGANYGAARRTCFSSRRQRRHGATVHGVGCDAHRLDCDASSAFLQLPGGRHRESHSWPNLAKFRPYTLRPETTMNAATSAGLTSDKSAAGLAYFAYPGSG